MAIFTGRDLRRFAHDVHYGMPLWAVPSLKTLGRILTRVGDNRCPELSERLDAS
jgi:hypothetical protein